MSSIFLFHRDLRIIDNLALTELASLSNDIIPIFIFTPEQVSSKNKYFNDNSVQFLVECIENLKKVTKNSLRIYYGETTKVLKSIFSNNDITHIAFNQDYTKYAKTRTQKVLKLAKKFDIEVIIKEDYTLLEMDQIRDGNYFSVFKPFYNKVISSKVENPKSKRTIMFSKKNIKGVEKYKDVDMKSLYNSNDDVLVHGDRKESLKILRNIRRFGKYNKDRNIPSINTTLLSAHIKFGTVSIREVYYSFLKLGKQNELIRQLVWHDFYAQIMNFLPYKNTLGGGNFKNKKIKWVSKKKLFNAWCQGKTGFPLIDAGMRQLNTVGWMHNRVRLVASNFLSLVLGIDWRKGEKYFAQKLVDYDPSSNNGNWQFSAQVGIDRVPYLRIYNPFKQSKDVDKDCIYIKEWVEELQDVENKAIHNWDRYCDEYDINYPCPIVNLTDSMKNAKKRYKFGGS